jgi:hypothetical protein
MNQYRPHLLVLPEDDANRQLANGFLLHPAVDPGRIQVLAPAGGWLKVLDAFGRNQLGDLRRFPDRHLLLVIDFDGDPDRMDIAWARIPEDVRGRVFILGAREEPETVRCALSRIGSLEKIGTSLAEDCRGDEPQVWTHPEFARNTDELDRMKPIVEPWLFRSVTL